MRRVERLGLARVLVAGAERDVDHVGDAPRARRHHDDALGEEDRLGDRVGDEHDRGARLGADPDQLGLHALARHLVQRAERLVHEQQRRPARERAGDRHALLHAARELAGAVGGEVREADELQQLERLPRAAPPCPARAAPAAARRCPGPCATPAARLLEGDAVVLVEARLPGRLAVDRDRARGRLDEVGDDPQQRRLAAARRARSARRTRPRRRSREIPVSASTAVAPSPKRLPTPSSATAARRRRRSCRARAVLVAVW